MAGLENALSVVGWPWSEVAGWRVSAVVWLETGASNVPHQDCPTAASFISSMKEALLFTIGIDPHKMTHTAAVLDHTENVIDELRLVADRHQRERLLRFASRFEPRTWAIEAASGLGALLAQQLVAAGEIVVDVPPTLSARVRLLDSTRTDKTDAHDARAAAIVALRHARLRSVLAVDHSAVLRLLADRFHDLTALRTQAICRLHALLCQLTPGGAQRGLSAQRAGEILRAIRPIEAVATERKRMALELLSDVRRFDNQLLATRERIVEAVLASGTTVTDVHGIGPIGAAIIIGHTGDIARFPDAGHYARSRNSRACSPSSDQQLVSSRPSSSLSACSASFSLVGAERNAHS